MSAKFEKLNIFFDRIKTIGFFQRIFQWRQISNLSHDAYREFKELERLFEDTTTRINELNKSTELSSVENDRLKSEKIKLENLLKSGVEKLEDTKGEVSDLKASIASKDEKISSLTEQIKKEAIELAVLKEKTSLLEQEMQKIKQENTKYEQTEAGRLAKHGNEMATIITIRDQIQSDRKKEIEEHQANEIARIEAMKETWSKHQEKVKNTIKSICQKHAIEYLDQVPFKGSPDNTVKICDEFVIFDAKSPSSDDLGNFPVYIKAQTEAVKKYIKEENVRKDIFLVVPSNTVDVIEQFSYNMADYNVYIITINVLEPLMLLVKKLEDYEFVNQLSPEEREDICRIIGKFAYMTKRRIQIDHFFTRQFLEILAKCEAGLPGEILDRVAAFEQSEKLNPPQEKRAKQILIKDLEKDDQKIQKEAEAKSVVFPLSLSRNIKNIPLYEGEESVS
ncbi:MAG: hypothetical protein Q7K71_06590 [Candidatus Omnitrophota bacterium]|nr:hypothetical protein [Candidatus Omnitrophota bacterium]